MIEIFNFLYRAAAPQERFVSILFGIVRRGGKPYGDIQNNGKSIASLSGVRDGVPFTIAFNPRERVRVRWLQKNNMYYSSVVYHVDGPRTKI